MKSAEVHEVLSVRPWIGEAVLEWKCGFRSQFGTSTLVVMGQEMQEYYKNLHPALYNVFIHLKKPNTKQV